MVNRGDALVELETDKVNVEVSAEQSGVLQKILKQEGDEVTVGDVLGFIEEGVEVSTGGPPETPAVQQPSAEQPQPVSTTADGQRPASPLAQRIAAEYHVDLSQVKGSSPHGRVTRDDVINYMEKASTQQAPSSSTIVTAAPTQTSGSIPSAPAVETRAREVPPIPAAAKPSLQVEHGAVKSVYRCRGVDRPLHSA